MSPTQVENR